MESQGLRKPAPTRPAGAFPAASHRAVVPPTAQPQFPSGATVGAPSSGPQRGKMRMSGHHLRSVDTGARRVSAHR